MDTAMTQEYPILLAFSILSFFVKTYNIFLSAKGLDHVAEKILGYLDAKTLCAAEMVCREWRRVISDGMLWKKLIERMVRSDEMWRGLAERKGW